jgi:acyl-CoA dehydrogenase
MALVLKFIKNYFFTNAGYPEIPTGRYIKDDSNVFNQQFGGLSKVQFNDYRKVYEGVDIPNVKLMLELADIYREFTMNAAPDKALSKNMDYMMGHGDIFTTFVYAQLILESAKIQNVDETLTNKIFGYLVRDINKYALTQLSAHNNTPEQAEYLKKMIFVTPEVDKEKDDKFFNEYVAVNDGVYMMKDCQIGLEN